ncbi:hypothetical protein BDW60DRAFT_187344 [Aspergillus nidulans var. acristatus]
MKRIRSLGWRQGSSDGTESTIATGQTPRKRLGSDRGTGGPGSYKLPRGYSGVDC